jgi:hypothetical protein
MFLAIALAFRFFLPAYVEVTLWLTVLGLLLIIAAVVWWLWVSFSPDSHVRTAPPHIAPRGDLLEQRTAKLESACRALEKVTDSLKARISEMQGLVEASGVKSENENLQDLLAKERQDRKLAIDLAEKSRVEAANTRQESSRLLDALTEKQKEYDAKEEENKKHQLKFNQAEEKLKALLKTESDRLGEVVPTRLMESSVGPKVRWCFDNAAKGDRLAAQILAALQSIKAAQDDVQLKGLLLSSLQVLGQSISRLSEREQYSPSQKCDSFNEWANALNDLAASRFTITVPSIGARINLTTMISSGGEEGSVVNVHCWGIRNEKGDLAYLAEIS